MGLDLTTLLVATNAVSALAGLACLMGWMQDRSQRPLGWMGLACGLGLVGTVLRANLPETAAILFGNIFVLQGFAALWAACRATRRSATKVWPFVLPSLVWLLACSVPAILASIDARIVVASALTLVLLGGASREMWLARVDRLQSQWIILGVLGAEEAFMALRLLHSALWPHQEAVTDPGRFFNMVALSTIGFGLLITFAMILLVKEASERRHRLEAETDGLTNLPNRRHFEAALAMAVAHSNRERDVLSLLMIDVDHFKLYNDTLGHPAGDACLRRVAHQLTASLRRPEDMAFRFGGEEFVVLLPGTDAQGAVAAAERLRAAVRGLVLPHPSARNGMVTVSIGAGEHRHGTDSTVLVEAVDRALYRAKAAGRDRVCGLLDSVDAAPEPPRNFTASVLPWPVHEGAGPPPQ